MNLREENSAGLQALMEIAGELIGLPGYDKPLTAIINRGGDSVSFQLGLALGGSSGWTARVMACELDPSIPIRPQTFATIDGRKWKITKVTQYAGSVLMDLGDPKN